MMLLMFVVASSTQKGCSGTQAEMNDCAYSRYLGADGAMNRQWKKTLEAERSDPLTPATQLPELHHGKTDVQLLIASQRAWLEYRDAQCEYEETGMPGTGGQALMFSCLEELTIQRTKQLRGMSDDDYSTRN